MHKIIDYAVVKAQDATTLATVVAARIQDGWQPLGGVSTGGIDRSTHLQAMVKYEEPDARS